MRNDAIGDRLYIYNSSTSRWYDVPLVETQTQIQTDQNLTEKSEPDIKVDKRRFGHCLTNVGSELFLLGGGLDDDSCSNQVAKIKLII